MLLEQVARSAEETFEMGRAMAASLNRGDIVLFRGDLGAGKTTMIRGIVAGVGYVGTVRSPTFNLIQLYEAEPPVMHADLYRLKSAEGLGLEDYWTSHLCLIEWPERLNGSVGESEAWKIEIAFVPEGRSIKIVPPSV
jgi:tRNA threonylcarbamoyladenosine biosynthesis protein TsaE